MGKRTQDYDKNDGGWFEILIFLAVSTYIFYLIGGIT